MRECVTTRTFDLYTSPIVINLPEVGFRWSENVSVYLKIIIIVELVVTYVARAVIGNLHPLWMRLLAFPYLPIVDLITIAVWVGCKKLGRQ